jgi:hypothetical protein
MRTPPSRRPKLPPWSRADCDLCGDPVEYVTLDHFPVQGEPVKRVAVVRQEDWRNGTIAARMIGSKLHGYTITNFRPILAGFIPLREHQQVCTEAVPPTEQQPLF